MFKMTTEFVPCFLCGELCTTPCPDCKEVFWCSKPHLSVHKSEDKCQPWIVARQEGVGRIVVASRDIEQWELVMKDTALAVVMESDYNCVLCGNIITGMEDFRCIRNQLLNIAIFIPAFLTFKHLNLNSILKNPSQIPTVFHADVD